MRAAFRPTLQRLRARMIAPHTLCSIGLLAGRSARHSPALISGRFRRATLGRLMFRDAITANH
jgi:hypothetical protein